MELPFTNDQIGDVLYEGSVYVDGKPVCDNSWDDKEALVVCRCGVGWWLMCLAGCSAIVAE